MTAMEFELPRAGRARLEIADLAGRRVATLVDDDRVAGRHLAVWQGRDDALRDAPAGLYFARLEHEGITRIARLVRVR
jgi:hypothetical protein